MLLDELLDWVELSLGADRAVEDDLVLTVIVQVDEMGFPALCASLVHRFALLARHGLILEVPAFERKWLKRPWLQGQGHQWRR